MWKKILLGFFVAVLLLELYAQYRIEVNSYIFQKIHDNPVSLGGVHITYPREMYFNMEDSGQYRLLFWGASPKGGIVLDRTPLRTIVDVETHFAQKPEHILKGVSQVEILGEPVVVANVLHVTTDTLLKIYYVLEKGVACGYVGPRENLEYFQPVLDSLRVE